MNFNFLNRDKLMGLSFGVMLYPLIQQAAPYMVVGFLDGLKERFTFTMLEKRIEVIRHAASGIQCPPSFADQPIVVQILDWDTRIVHEQESNQRKNQLIYWPTYLLTLGYYPINSLSDIFSTDRWNDVQEIPLPCETEVISDHRR
jgi:hypothetical protein